jgi:transcriptional regulator with XRE-family HTH domain
MQKNAALLARFGVTVKTLREERGYTQRDLANRAGMTEKHVGEIERGLSEASITAIVALAKGLQVKVSRLMPDNEKPTHEPPRPSYAQWRTVYESTLELNETASEVLGFRDSERGENNARTRRGRPPRRPIAKRVRP